MQKRRGIMFARLSILITFTLEYVSHWVSEYESLFPRVFFEFSYINESQIDKRIMIALKICILFCLQTHFNYSIVDPF